jgi:hypothetical protein
MIIYAMFAHWIADFIVQRHVWASSKWNSKIALTKHVASYTAVMWLMLVWFGFGWEALLIGALHWPVDFVTSKITHKLYEKGDVHNFFVVVGFDQWLHFVTIIWLLN